MKYKLSPAGVCVPVYIGATPEIDKRVIISCPAKVARNARRAPRGGCPGGASLTKTIFETADRRALKAYASKGW